MSVGIQIPAEKLAALELLTPRIQQLLFPEIGQELELCDSISETGRNFDMTLRIKFHLTSLLCHLALQATKCDR